MIRAIWLPGLFLGLSVVAALFHWVFWLAVIVFLADVYGRLQDYNDLRSLSSQKRRMYLHLYAKTACGRQVMIAVEGKFARGYFRMLGYRPYHLLPDKTFSKHSPFIRLAFWMGLATGHGVRK